MSHPDNLWRRAVRRGVDALGFSLVPLARGETWMAAEVARTDLPPLAATAAAAAIGMDKDVALSETDTPIGRARAALKAAIGSAPHTDKVTHYLMLLDLALWSAVELNPQLLLEALAEPYE